MRIRYNLDIRGMGLAKIQAIKMIRIVTGMGLKEAKILMERGDASLAGEREIPSLRSDEEELQLIAGDLDRTARTLERQGVRFNLDLAISAEIGNFTASMKRDLKFDRDRFYGFRNLMRKLAEIDRRSEERAFESGPVSITAMSHEDGGVSWTCHFDQGRPFRGTGLKELEDLLVSAGEIWWG